jgi:predicted nucleic-acid-binding protein
VTALDTNVLVRIITNDDRAQAARAAAFLREQEQVFIPKTVMLELEWVLRSAYRIERRAIAAALRAVLEVSKRQASRHCSIPQAAKLLSRKKPLCNNDQGNLRSLTRIYDKRRRAHQTHDVPIGSSPSARFAGAQCDRAILGKERWLFISR